MSSNESTDASTAPVPQPRSATTEQPTPQNSRVLAPLIPADFEPNQQQQYTSDQLTTPTQDGPGGFGRVGGPRSPAVPPPPYIPPTYDAQHLITSPNTTGPPGGPAYPRSPNAARRGGGPGSVVGVGSGSVGVGSNSAAPPRGGGTPGPAPGMSSPPPAPGALKGEDGEGVDPSKYKTKMCANFLNNACTWGSECAFAHGPNELRQPPPGCPRSPNIQGEAAEAPPQVNYQLGRTNSWSKHPQQQQQQQVGGSGAPPSSAPVVGGPPPPSYNHGPPQQQQQQQALSVSVASAANNGQQMQQPPLSPTTPNSNGSNAPPPMYPTRFRHEPYSPSKAKTYISSNPTSPKTTDPGAYPTIPLGPQ